MELIMGKKERAREILDKISESFKVEIRDHVYGLLEEPDLSCKCDDGKYIELEKCDEISSYIVFQMIECLKNEFYSGGMDKRKVLQEVEYQLGDVEEVKRYEISVDVTKVTGFIDFVVEASSKEEALMLLKSNGAKVLDEHLSVDGYDYESLSPDDFVPMD
jgi:hypothetical protein